MKVSPGIQIPLNNLSIPLSSFIGREREIEEVKQLLKSLCRVTFRDPSCFRKTQLPDVTRILNKLGYDSRVQIATWTVEKRLVTRVYDSVKHF